MPYKNVSIVVTEFTIGGFDKTEQPLTVGVVILIVYVLVILANVLNVLFIIFDKRLHKPMYLLIANLAIVDIVYTSSASPTIIEVLLAGEKTISYVPCLFEMFVFHLGGVMEMFALSVMAFDRLLAVSYPFQYHIYLTNIRTLVVVMALWLVASCFVTYMLVNLLSLPHCHSRLKYTFCDYAAIMRTTCADIQYHFNIIAIISFFLLFFTFSFICLSYLGIILLVKLTKDDKRKMGGTCLTHFIVVACYFCPVFVRIILTRLGLVLTLEARQGLMMGAILGPSLVNPFVYCLRTSEIRCQILKVYKQATTCKSGVSNSF